MEWWKAAAGYLLGMNLAGFISMGADKYKAKHNAWRIRERTLLLIAVLGGSVGSLTGMYVFRHKTKHGKFVIGIPVIIAVQAGVILWLNLD